MTEVTHVDGVIGDLKTIMLYTQSARGSLSKAVRYKEDIPFSGSNLVRSLEMIDSIVEKALEEKK